TEALLAAPTDDARGDPLRHAGRLGPLLQLAQRVGPLPRRQVDQGPAGVRAGVAALPPDVRQHRDRDRQRAGGALDAVGAVDRDGDAAVVPDHADAAAAGARAGALEHHAADGRVGPRPPAGPRDLSSTAAPIRHNTNDGSKIERPFTGGAFDPPGAAARPAAGRDPARRRAAVPGARL